MSEQAFHPPDVQDPQNKQLMSDSEPAFDLPDEQDPQNKLPMSEQAPHTSAKSLCLTKCSDGRDAQCRLGFQRWHRRKVCTSSSPLCTVLSPADRINAKLRNPLALTSSLLKPTKQPMRTNSHNFLFGSKDVLTGSSKCG